MDKRVILITGTPAVGKTTLAKRLAKRINAQYINLTELSQIGQLTLERDKQRDTIVVDEAKMRRTIIQLVSKTQHEVVIDGHYSAAVTPRAIVTKVFVLRRNPEELRELMRKRGYNEPKQNENLAAEILDVCLVEALQKQTKSKVCELDVTGRKVEDTLQEVLDILEGRKQCHFGIVDWLGTLEREGKLDDYLKD